jgi:AcrR family transcriptional regulator
MATISKNKIKHEALVKATINLVNNNGFRATTMSKIAEEANVATATIYLYFKNKQDLINKVYNEVKSEFNEYAFKDYDELLPVEEGFEIIWKNIADFYLNETEHAMFISQCDNTPVIDDSTRQGELSHLQALLDLWERGQKEGGIKQMSPYLLYACTIYPLVFLMNMKKHNVFQISPDQLEDLYQSAWNSISARSFFLLK